MAVSFIVSGITDGLIREGLLYFRRHVYLIFFIPNCESDLRFLVIIVEDFWYIDSQFGIKKIR
jgi:hypothetical protein